MGEPTTKRYDELDEIGGLGRHAWGVFGPDDELGTLNRLTPERVAAAAAGEVRTGERISLQLPPRLPDPPLFGRGAMRHEIFQTGRNNWDDRLDEFYLQRATQWDGFRHVRLREFGFYGGVTDDPDRMPTRLGIHHWALKGIVGRGVLVDVASHLESSAPAYDPFAPTSIPAATLADCVADQGLQVKTGDILCVRTGWARRYCAASHAVRQELARPEPRPDWAGLAGTEDVARLLWDWGVSALAVDNPAVEWSPGDRREGSLHRRLLAQLGMPLGELYDFEALRGRCEDDSRWTFFFVSVPLAVEGGVGSPANAVAIR